MSARRREERRDPAPSLEELAAFADGELRRRDARRVAAHLRRHPADADRVRAWIAGDAALRDAHAGVSDEPLPEALRRLVARGAGEPGPPPAVRSRTRRAALAAAVLLGTVVGLGAWLGTMPRGAPTGPAGDRAPASAASFVGAVLDAYREGRAAGSPDRSVSAPPVLASAPDLGFAGLDLVSAHELERGGHAFAEYVYRDRQARRVVLYERADAPLREGVLRIVEREGLHVVEWAADRHHFALVGDAPVARLAGLAARVRGGPPGPALAGSAESAPSPPPEVHPPGGPSAGSRPLAEPTARPPAPGASPATAIQPIARPQEM